MAAARSPALVRTGAGQARSSAVHARQTSRIRPGEDVGRGLWCRKPRFSPRRALRPWLGVRDAVPAAVGLVRRVLLHGPDPTVAATVHRVRRAWLVGKTGPRRRRKDGLGRRRGGCQPVMPRRVTHAEQQDQHGAEEETDEPLLAPHASPGPPSIPHSDRNATLGYFLMRPAAHERVTRPARRPARVRAYGLRGIRSGPGGPRAVAGQVDDACLRAQDVVFEGEPADGLFVQVQGPAQVGVLLPQAPQVVLGPFSGRERALLLPGGVSRGVGSSW